MDTNFWSRVVSSFCRLWHLSSTSGNPTHTRPSDNFLKINLCKLSTGDLLDFLKYFIQNCFICRPSDSAVSEDAWIEPRIVATLT
jgi:hypothetical protein